MKSRSITGWSWNALLLSCHRVVLECSSSQWGPRKSYFNPITGWTNIVLLRFCHRVGKQCFLSFCHSINPQTYTFLKSHGGQAMFYFPPVTGWASSIILPSSSLYIMTKLNTISILILIKVHVLSWCGKLTHLWNKDDLGQSLKTSLKLQHWKAS